MVNANCSRWTLSASFIPGLAAAHYFTSSAPEMLGNGAEFVRILALLRVASSMFLRPALIPLQPSRCDLSDTKSPLQCGGGRWY
jgi:hypothetical protein